MAFSKARRLSDFIAADGTIPTAKFASGTITSAHIADTAITHADLHTDMNLTSKTVLVANASTGDSDTTAANTAFVQQEIAALVDSSPSALNTLNELAAALGDDANFSTTVNASIAAKLPLAGGTMTGNITINKEDPNINLSDSSSSRTLAIFVDNNNSVVRASGPLLLQVGSQSAITIDASRNTTLAGALVGTTAAFNSGAANVVATFTSTDGYAAIKLADNGGNVELTAVGNDFHIQNAGGAAKMIVTSAGNAHLSGQIDARIQLSSSGGANIVSDNAVYVRGNDDTVILNSAANGDIKLSENGTDRLFIKRSTGKVGIGTSDPDSKLEVVTSSTAIDYTLRLKNTNTTDDNGTAILFQGKDTSGNDVSYGALKFKYTNHVTEKSQFQLWHMNNSGTPTQAVTLDHDGRFGIGTTTPDALLDLEKAASGTSFISHLQVGQTGTVANSKYGIDFKNTTHSWNQGRISVERQGANSDFDMVLSSAGSGSLVEGIRIDPTGKVGIGTAAPTAKLHVATGSLMVTPVNTAHNGAYHIIGSVANYSTANGRYIHAQLSTAQNNMFHIIMEGYTYTTGQRSGRCSGYVYNYASGNNGATGSFGGPGVYDGRVSGNIVAMFSNSNNARIEVVIDTGNTGTGNRWGSYTLVGGDDHISSYAAIEVVQYTTSSNAARQYTS